jgi:hypothetical protein
MRALFCALKSGQQPVNAWIPSGQFVDYAAKNRVFDSAKGGWRKLLISGS